MKPVGMIALFMVLALALAACQGQQSPQEGTDGTSTAETEETTLPDVANLDDGVTKILCIGNSFTVDMLEYVRHIADSAGYSDLLIGKLLIGGSTLNNHLAIAQINSAAYEYGRSTPDGGWFTVYKQTMAQTLQSKNWDYVLVQQNSSNSGKPFSYSVLDDLLDIIQTHTHPDTKFIFNMTWAYQQNSTHAEFQYYHHDQMEMYSAIVEAVQTMVVPNERIDILVSTGSAIQNARTSWVGDTLTMDGYHLSRDRGRYVAAMAFCKTVLGIDLNQATYRPAGVSEAFRQVAVEAAENAHTKPFEITPSAFTEAPHEEATESILFAELTDTHNGAGGLTFYHSVDGGNLLAYTQYDEEQGRWYDDTDGQLTMVDPAEDKLANYGLGQCSAAKVVAMGLKVTQAGPVDLYNLTTICGPEGTYTYTVRIAQGTPDNTVAQYTLTGVPGSSQEERYRLEVQEGEEIYLIYQLTAGADLGGWFGYRNTLTYCIP